MEEGKIKKAKGKSEEKEEPIFLSYFCLLPF
jgi:hypothetical protein